MHVKTSIILNLTPLKHTVEKFRKSLEPLLSALYREVTSSRGLLEGCEVEIRPTLNAGPCENHIVADLACFKYGKMYVRFGFLLRKGKDGKYMASPYLACHIVGAPSGTVSYVVDQGINILASYVAYTLFDDPDCSKYIDLIKTIYNIVKKFLAWRIDD